MRPLALCAQPVERVAQLAPVDRQAAAADAIVQRVAQTGGTCEFNVLTMVAWANEEAVAPATVFVKRKFADEGFDPAAFTRNAGVRSDQGFYSVA